MTHLTPSIYGMWSVCSVLFTAFCVYHLWHYDRFNCLRMNQGPYSGAFGRVMTYTFLLSLPLITTYSVGFAVIKYEEGFVYSPEHGVFPKPYSAWTKTHQDAVFPMTMLLSVCFSLEMITHLEELCFWAFLMTTSSRDWSRSIYFLIWSCGSVISLVIVPTATIVFRNDPLRDEAYTFLIGSSGSLTLTLFFVPILYFFPAFLQRLAQQGVEKSTVIRLRTFHELNRLRFIFKLIFAIPLFTLGIDGMEPHNHPINESVFWTELLGMSSAFGCIISSALTLLIFFPRNTESEFESSYLGRLTGRVKEQQKSGPDTLVSSWERDRLAFSSDTSIGSSPLPPVRVIYPTNFTSRYQVEDEYYSLPKYQPPGIPGIEPRCNTTAKVSTPIPSIVNGTILRPNRLCPDGRVEWGCVQGHPAPTPLVKL